MIAGKLMRMGRQGRNPHLMAPALTPGPTIEGILL
ncbi:hypothetical protein FHT86_002849 [Rhizobium sp. BK313]|nr:hypothetical protein [Rhizobium sp. BK313]